MRAKRPNFLPPSQRGCPRSLNMQTPTYLSMPETLGLQANAMISQLNEIFPPTNPTPDDTMEKIMYRSGQRSVVEWIISYMEEN